jgi:hypothetical protein
LNEDERKLFKSIVDDRTLLKELGKTRKTRLFRKGFKGYRHVEGDKSGKYKKYNLKKVTIEQWLHSIYDPLILTAKNPTTHKHVKVKRDLLSAIGGDNHSMGRFPDESGPIKEADRQLVKFEARGLDRGAYRTIRDHDQPAAKWLDFAEAMFKSAHDNRNLPGSKLSYHPKKCQ